MIMTFSGDIIDTFLWCAAMLSLKRPKADISFPIRKARPITRVEQRHKTWKNVSLLILCIIVDFLSIAMGRIVLGARTVSFKDAKVSD